MILGRFSVSLFPYEAVLEIWIVIFGSVLDYRFCVIRGFLSNHHIYVKQHQRKFRSDRVEVYQVTMYHVNPYEESANHYFCYNRYN